MRAQETVEWAVIPAAGKGTRMHPVSRFVPKELLPLGTRPIIQFTLQEALRAGINNIAVVVSPQKPLLGDFLKDFRKRWPGRPFRLELVAQPEPLGLADAIGCCRHFVEGGPFAILLPDNALFSPLYCLSSLVELYGEWNRDVMGIIELGAEHSGLYGNCGRISCQLERPGVFTIQQLDGKLPGQLEVPTGQSILRSCGRYVAAPWIFEYIDLIRPQVEGEFDEVPVYQQIIRDHQATGYLIPPPLFDTGNEKGYLAANAFLSEQQQRL